MKKFIMIPAAAGVLALGGIVFANAENQAEPTNAEGTVQVQTEVNKEQTDQGEYLSFEEISARALQEADGKVTDIEFDQDDRKPHYDIDVYAEGIEHELKLDAVTGEVLEHEQERDDDDRNGDSIPNTGELISSEEAIAAAQKAAGGTVEEIGLDYDDGVAHYDIELRDGRAEHEVKVNAENGSILEMESDDEDDDD